MSLTVSDCLKLPSLRSAKVIAGHKGLSNIVNNVSVLEIYDAELFSLEAPVNDSDMTLTSFRAIADNYELQCKHIEQMHSLGDAAVVIYYVGIYLKEIHPSLIETADRLGFPLIIMPEGRIDCFYREVLYDVYKAIFHAKNKEKDLINNVVALFSRLPEDRKNLTNLLRLISDSLKCTVLLSDTVMNNVCLSKYPASNDITASDIHQLYEKTGCSDSHGAESLWQGRVLRIFRLPFTVFEYRNFSIYAIDEFGSLTMDDMYDVVELLEIFSKLWNLDADNILENSLISSILDGDSEKMRQISTKLSIDIRTINTSVFLRPSLIGLEPQGKLRLQREMVQQIKSCSEGWGKTVIVDTYESLIVSFIMYSSTDNTDREYLQEMTERLDTLCTNYTISFFPCDNKAEETRKTYLLYSETIPLAISIFPDRKLFSYGDILFAHQCETICREKNDSFRICRNILKPLLEDADSDALLETLSVYYLDASCEVKATASQLFVHRNTIQYRLAKIHAITNFKTDDFLSNNLMYQAIACYRLHPELFEV
ncbi:PucR family transcriptional regulator [Senimuribacter intestinalis]|uniref:PucR family transcriptional regulator n=1 Tax=Senimuribacter intestinalis TaxID=2941507 RepID=UPI0020416100|nr:PucR family transcriptional regulator [Senimuribacter intestinalis]